MGCVVRRGLQVWIAVTVLVRELDCCGGELRKVIN